MSGRDDGRAERLRARFEGRVQGVGFRFAVVRLAARLDVTGYVMNLPDGSVELVAEGERAEVDELLRKIRTSHLGRHIERDACRRGEATGQFDAFGIRTS